jgi:aromatase
MKVVSHKTVTHEIVVAAPAATIYGVIADVTLWPLHFKPTVHAERLTGDTDTDTDTEPDTEQIRIWALANGELRTWISQRRLDETARTIAFEQVQPTHPVAHMAGTWRITERDDGSCQVVLEHSYRAVDDDPANLARIDTAVDTNSASELASLKLAAESAESLGELTLDFSDTEDIDGRVEDAYDFIYDLRQWPERIPHVQRMVVTEDVPGLQVMEMDTKAPDGSVHTTVSGRVCFAPDRIVYKQTTVAGALRAHIGEWRFENVHSGVRVTSRHVVILDADALGHLPKPPASLAEARTAVRNALGGNSRTTMAHAKTHIEEQSTSKNKGVSDE